MTDSRLVHLIQQLPVLKPNDSVWGRIESRVNPTSKVPNPWLSLGFATAVLVFAAMPIFNHQTNHFFPESYVALAEMVEETEQMKQEVLFENAMRPETTVGEWGLMYRVDSLDEIVHRNRNLSIVDRQKLLQQQMDTLVSLQYLQRENTPAVRRVSF